MIVDSGDLLNEDEEVPEAVRQSAMMKAEVVVKILKKIGMDAVNVGELDLALGIKYLQKLAKDQSFPFVSANIADRHGVPIFPRYVIKNINGKNIGIFGIIGDTSELSEKIDEITKGAVKVLAPVTAAQDVVRELKTKKVDYVIALTHQGINRDWVVARRVPGIDLVIGGHDRQKTREPYEAEKSLIVQAGEKGQYQGILKVIVNGDQKPQNELIPYGDDIQNDAAIKSMLDAYNDRLAIIYGRGEDNPAADNKVVLRLAACDPCHGDQVSKWKTSPHAKAYDTLVKKSKQFDPNCIKCHTTRFSQPEGFDMKAQQPALVNIQCESCHGLAKEHLQGGKQISIARPQIDGCTKCHTPDRCPTFKQDSVKVLAAIKH